MMRRAVLAFIPLALLAALLVLIVRWGPAEAVRGEDYPPVERLTFQRLTLEPGSIVVNVTEFDPVNSLHLHGMFFDVYRTGTSLTPSDKTDTILLCQGERAILETTFRYPGEFMFHAHQSEFAELGWMGLFDVTGGVVV